MSYLSSTVSNRDGDTNQRGKRATAEIASATAILHARLQRAISSSTLLVSSPPEEIQQRGDAHRTKLLEFATRS